MSDGYRNRAFALGLVVGGGIALNLFLWLDYRARREIEGDPKAQHDSEYSQVGSAWDGLIGTFVSPSDTLAQWVMAFFTIAATGVLILTLRSANKTNLAAVQASTAALEANVIMRHEQRPWLVMRMVYAEYMPSVSINGDAAEAAIRLDISFENCGRTPAVRVAMGSVAEEFTKRVQPNAFAPWEIEYGDVVVAPNGLASPISNFIDGENVIRFLRSEIDICIAVYCKYTSIDGNIEGELNTS